MYSAAWVEAARRGAETFPVLDVAWVSRGFSLGSGVYSPRMREGLKVTAVTKPGTWQEIVYGSGVGKTGLETVRTSVSVADADRSLLTMLELYDPRGSVARIRWGAAGLVAADWEPQFLGVVEDFTADEDKEGPYVKLLLKVDDTVLRKPIPTAIFTPSEWGSASETTIHGTHMSLCFGVFDSFLVTARGAVPCANIRYDADIGYWWAVSASNQVNVRRVYLDGVLQLPSIWTTVRGVYGGQFMTVISFLAGYQPAEGVAVTCDVEGPDANGLAVGPAITNPVAVLRAAAEEWGFRDAPLGAWRGAVAAIDNTSWQAVQDWLDARDYDCARRFGGDQNIETLADVFESFLQSNRWATAFYTPLGTIALGIVDADDFEPSASEYLDLDLYQDGGGRIAYQPGDRREVYSKIQMPYLWSPAESKFERSQNAVDLSTLADEQVPLEIQNEWAQGRLLQE